MNKYVRLGNEKIESVRVSQSSLGLAARFGVDMVQLLIQVRPPLPASLALVPGPLVRAGDHRAWWFGLCRERDLSRTARRLSRVLLP